MSGAEALGERDGRVQKRQDTLSNKEKDAMGDMRIVQEMYARGFEFEPIDIFRAQSRSFQIVDGN